MRILLLINTHPHTALNSVTKVYYRNVLVSFWIIIFFEARLNNLPVTSVGPSAELFAVPARPGAIERFFVVPAQTKHVMALPTHIHTHEPFPVLLSQIYD